MNRDIDALHAATSRCIDPHIGLASTDGREHLYRRLLLMFEQGQHDAVERIRAARAAGDRSGATRLAHNLRSGAGTLGMLPLAEVAMRLELACRSEADPVTVLPALLDEVRRMLEPVLLVLRALRLAGPDASLLDLLR